MKEQIHEVNVGAVILAPGFAPFDPSIFATYGYAAHPNVVTSLEFERILSASGPYEGHLVRPSDDQPPKKSPGSSAWDPGTSTPATTGTAHRCAVCTPTSRP
jgi:heterodisulfide reductase subunit A-like polyferredoxin